MKLTYKMLKEAKESERLILESKEENRGIILHAIRDYCLDCGDCYSEDSFECGDVTLESVKNWKLETLKKAIKENPSFSIEIAQLIPNASINGSDVTDVIESLTDEEFNKYIKPKIKKVDCMKENGKKAKHPFARPCKFCGNWFIFNDLEEQNAWEMVEEKKERIKLAQEIAPDMKPEYIELILLSHTCNDCYNAMFNPMYESTINESAMNDEIREWYMKEYPTDELGSSLRGTFSGAMECLNAGDDIYDYIGVGDSIIRERLFSQLAQMNNVDYGYIYNLWLNA
ncbi:MAG: hypothetical protein MJZ34_07230 [Paludibacteraceae bacterium]|nr:hypothetical protein [Paludibacteraceae bacterium]